MGFGVKLTVQSFGLDWKVEFEIVTHLLTRSENVTGFGFGGWMDL